MLYEKQKGRVGTATENDNTSISTVLSDGEGAFNHNTQEITVGSKNGNVNFSARNRMSAVVSQLVNGEFSLSNTTEKLVDTTVLYTGNGGTQNITTGISTIDFTVSSNGTGYWLDRSVPAVKTDAGTVIGTSEIDFADVVGVDGVSRVVIKDRDSTGSHFVVDGLRGVDKYIYTDLTDDEDTTANTVIAFTTTGVTLGSSTAVNANTSLQRLEQTLYTHIAWGTTNQGKFYVTAFNPQSGASMTYYIGSGVAGHEIPHGLWGMDFAEEKVLSQVSNWRTQALTNNKLYTNLDNAAVTGATHVFTDTSFIADNSGEMNQVDEPSVVYGFANAYYNEDGDRVGSYEVGTYIGTGAVGNVVETQGKPAPLKVKHLSGVGDWYILDNQRGFDTGFLFLNTSDSEFALDRWNLLNSGFSAEATFSDMNAASGHYLYIVSYDTKLNGGGSYEDIPTNTTNLQLSNGLVSVTDGYDANGLINGVISKDGTITLPSISEAGDYWPYVDDTGTVSISAYEPAWSDSNADGFRPVLNLRDMKWYEDYAVFKDDFSTDTSSNYTGRFGNETITVINGELKVEAGQIGGLAWSSALTGLTIGKRYKLPIEAKGVDTRVLIAEDTAFTNSQTLVEYQAVGAFSSTFTATAATMYIAFGNGQSVGATSYYPYWSLVPLNDDGSVDYSSATDMGSVGWLGKINVDADGSVQRVEQLPRTAASEVIEAEKLITPKIEGTPQVLTATAYMSGANPPVFSQSFNISGALYEGVTGRYEVFFEEEMDNEYYFVEIKTDQAAHIGIISQTTTSFRFQAINVSDGLDRDISGVEIKILVTGGKNV